MHHFTGVVILGALLCFSARRAAVGDDAGRAAVREEETLGEIDELVEARLLGRGPGRRWRRGLRLHAA